MEHVINLPFPPLSFCSHSGSSASDIFTFSKSRQSGLPQVASCALFPCGDTLRQNEDVTFNAPDYLMPVAFILIEDERGVKCVQNRILMRFSVCFVITQIIGTRS